MNILDIFQGDYQNLSSVGKLLLSTVMNFGTFLQYLKDEEGNQINEVESPVSFFGTEEENLRKDEEE